MLIFAPRQAKCGYVSVGSFASISACPRHVWFDSNLGHVSVTPVRVAGSRSVSWDQEFFDPIELPGRKPLLTLRDAAMYITKQPKAEHDAEEWQAAMEALLLVAEHKGPTMFARIAVMRALNRNLERVFDASRKDHHWGRRKLARDR
jgi:hypothetical protein